MVEPDVWTSNGTTRIECDFFPSEKQKNFKCGEDHLITECKNKFTKPEPRQIERKFKIQCIRSKRLPRRTVLNLRKIVQMVNFLTWHRMNRTDKSLMVNSYFP